MLAKQTKTSKTGVEYLFCECGNPIHSENFYVLCEESDAERIICPMCYYPMNLDSIASTNMGILIYSPDMSQEQVNSLAIMLTYLKSFDDEDLYELTEDLMSILKKRQDLLESVYGEGTSDPAIFCQFLFSMEDDEYANREKFVNGIRFLPDSSVINSDVKFYQTNILKNFHPTKWRSLLQSISK